MSQLIARLLLTIFLVPLTILVAVVVSIVAYETIFEWSNDITNREAKATAFITLITWAFFAGCWIGIWRKGVRWTPRRVSWTWIWPFASALFAAIIGVLFGMWEDGIGYFFAAVSAPLIWVVGTILIWRETNAERAERLKAAHADVITCPTCGYNLTGLSEARCPECGTKFTLNDLYANQPSREAARVEQEIGG
jgi:hypothetical protein